MSGSQRVERGHSLLEMIVAVMIFATAATALNGIWVLQYRAMTSSRTLIVASHFTEQIVEEALEAGYYGVDAWAAGYPPGNSTIIGCTVAGKALSTEFFPTVSVTPYSGSYKHVSVLVEYSEKNFKRKVKYDVLLSPTT